MKKSTHSTYQTNPEIAFREIKGQLLFLRPDDRQLYTTNDTGRFIWQGLVRKTPVEKLIRLFQKQFGLTEDAATRDVRKFLAELEKRKIIVRATAP
jgi:hypothetical protein